MGYANNIGRVGALAVTLGVGWAIASAPGVAYADTSDSSASSESSSSASADSDAPSSPSSQTDDSGAGGSSSAHDETESDSDEPNDTDPDVTDAGETDTDADEVAAEAAADAEAGQQTGTSEGPAPEDENAPDEETAAGDTGQAYAASVDASEPQPGPARATARTTLVTAISEVVTSLFQPRPEPAPVTPLQGSTMLASLAAVRDQLERSTNRRAAPSQTVGLLADTPNVLVIGVDGTNLSRVLADPANVNFFKLIQGGTTAASSIVGHTTVSNPSWSSILTGAWGEKTGVINNVFTPWTYNKWPTVFTQLESLNPDIETTSIANWNVISAIASSGLGVDNLFNVPELADDPRWLKSDDLVGDLTEIAIANASSDVANLMFSYFVGVDENGHLYGGDSPEYAEAIRNFDRNLGEIMQAVDTWEAATGEQWTILMVTDHGHQPQQGLGHGFQSPDETSTFVVANNPDLFTTGGVNLKYSIIDVTPTLMDLFGFEPSPDSDGVSLTDLGGSTLTPADDDAALRAALQDAIAMNGYPDIATNIALSIRTIAATIPYYVDNIVNGITSGLQSLADGGVFLISPLAALAIVPVKFFGDLAYVATNIVAQIVARLTGVTGASIFPLVRPEPPTFPETPDGVSTPDLVAAACTGGRVSSAVFACGAPAIAV